MPSPFRPHPAPPHARPPASSVLDEAARRLLDLGPEALSPQELLTLLLAPGGGRHAAAASGRRLLREFGDLRGLAAAGAFELHGVGLSEGLVARLVAAFALGRCVHAARLPSGRLLRGSREIHEAFGGRLRDLKKERFLVVLLDGRHRVIREVVVSEGILTASLVHPREVFAVAIREHANSLVLVHNHPSGDPEPSPEDLEITRRLAAVGDLVGIRVEDHLVIGDGTYVSFLDRGLLAG